MRRPRLPDPVRRFLRGRTLPWILVVLSLAAAGTFFSLWSGGRAEDARRAEVQATAATFLSALTNFSADSIERDVEEIRAYAIADFAEEVEQTFSDERVTAIRESGAESHGEVRNLFVESLDEDAATVFAVVDETVANDTTPPRRDVLRVVVDLVETESGWRVSGVEILQSPAGAPLP